MTGSILPTNTDTESILPINKLTAEKQQQKQQQQNHTKKKYYHELHVMFTNKI